MRGHTVLTKPGVGAGQFWKFYDTEYHAYKSEAAVDRGLGKPNETDRTGTTPLIDREATPENRIAFFRAALYKAQPIVATLTGVYDADHFDLVRNQKLPVFRIIAVKDIRHPSNDKSR